MFRRVQGTDDRGAVAVLVAIVLAFVLIPLTALASGTYVRATARSELQRSADSGSLAAAAQIPLGDVNFLLNYLDATSGGETSQTLNDLGITTYQGEDPLGVACDVANENATGASTVGNAYATDQPTCKARYLGDPDVLVALRSCATAVTGYTGSPLGLGTLDELVPSLAGLLPALLRPGVKVTMSRPVKGPLDNVFKNVNNEAQNVGSIARRRFKNVVVVPTLTRPISGRTIDLNPTVGDVRTTVLDVLTRSETVLRSNSFTSPCADVLAASRDDITDIVDPPGSAPNANELLEEAFTSRTPIITLVYGTTIPFLDFVSVCVDAAPTGTGFVGRTTDFGTCSVDAPGGFRASLRNS